MKAATKKKIDHAIKVFRENEAEIIVHNKGVHIKMLDKGHPVLDFYPTTLRLIRTHNCPRDLLRVADLEALVGKNSAQSLKALGVTTLTPTGEYL